MLVPAGRSRGAGVELLVAAHCRRVMGLIHPGRARTGVLANRP